MTLAHGFETSATEYFIIHLRLLRDEREFQMDSKTITYCNELI